MQFLPLIEPANGVTELHVRLDVNAGHIDSSQPSRVVASSAFGAKETKRHPTSMASLHCSMPFNLMQTAAEGNAVKKIDPPPKVERKNRAASQEAKANSKTAAAATESGANSSRR